MEPHFVVDTRHHGKGAIVFAWHPQGIWVATSGSSRVVHVFDASGRVSHQIVLPSPSVCTALEWDRTGEVLAAIQAGSSILVLWSAVTREVHRIETNAKELTFMKWSKAGDELALGTAKGTVIIYDRLKEERLEVGARHKKKIICGDWNEDDKLVFGSEDRQIAICTARGEVLDQVKLQCRPLDLSVWGKEGEEEEEVEDHGPRSVVAVNMDGRTLLLYNMQHNDHALELAFQGRYGAIVAFKWFGDGYIMVGFSSGYVVVISTHEHEIGREQFCAKLHMDELRNIAYCPFTNMLASCGDGSVKLIDMNDWQELQSFELEKEHGQLDQLAWADQGRLLSVSSRSGCLYTFLIQSPEVATNDTLLTHSLIVEAMKPLAPGAMVFSFLSAGAVLSLVAATALGLNYRDFLRIVAGTSEAV